MLLKLFCTKQKSRSKDVLGRLLGFSHRMNFLFEKRLIRISPTSFHYSSDDFYYFLGAVVVVAGLVPVVAGAAPVFFLPKFSKLPLASTKSG